MPAGRPTSYRPEYCRLIVEYFQQAVNAPVRELAPITTDITGEKPSKKTEVRSICAELPTLEGFAISIGVSSQTVLNWADAHPDFLEAHARAKDIQKQVLVDRGLTRQYDPSAFMFVAQNITNMRDSRRLELEAEISHSMVIQLVVAQSGGGQIAEGGPVLDITALVEEE